MRAVIVCTAVVVVVSACGGTGAGSGGPLTLAPETSTAHVAGPVPSTISSTAPRAPSTSAPAGTVPDTTVGQPVGGQGTDVVVYFLDEHGQAVAAHRTVTETGIAAAAIRTLIAGPDASETLQGLSTAFPADTVLLGVDIDAGTAVVDLSAEFQAGGGSATTLGRLAQLVYTLTEFSSVERVELRLDGRSLEIFGSEGVGVEGPLTRDDFESAVPIRSATVGTGTPIWDQSDLPSEGERHRVVLVAADDYLNVRTGPGAGQPLMGRLLPGVEVSADGATRTVDGSKWDRIVTPSGAGWVNGFYLTPSRAQSTGDITGVVADLAQRFAGGKDFTDLVSSRGLWVAHHAPPMRFPRDEIPGLLESHSTFRWGSNALEPNSPEIEPRTFAEAVARRFVDTQGDTDTVVLVDDVVEGPNGRPAALAIPTEFKGFRFVTVHDPGDEAVYEGLDWTTWIVSLSFEDGEWRIVGLTVDEWAP